MLKCRVWVVHWVGKDKEILGACWSTSLADLARPRPVSACLGEKKKSIVLNSWSLWFSWIRHLSVCSNARGMYTLLTFWSLCRSCVSALQISVAAEDGVEDGGSDYCWSFGSSFSWHTEQCPPKLHFVCRRLRSLRHWKPHFHVLRLLCSPFTPMLISSLIIAVCGIEVLSNMDFNHSESLSPFAPFVKGKSKVWRGV